MSEQFYAGQTSQTIDVFLGDSSSTTGGGLTGLAYNTSGLKCYYRKGATGTPTEITLATQTVGGAWSSGGFVQVDSTNMPGVYRFDVPNAVIDTAGMVTLYFYGATNLVQTAQRIDCRAVRADNRDGDAIPASNGGSGAYVVTITVNDGSTALQNATVRMTEGANTFEAATNVSGQASFSLDAATYTVSITKAGYEFTPTTLAVSGATTHTYSMSAMNITPSNPWQTTGYITIRDGDGNEVANAIVDVQITKYAYTDTGNGIDDPLISRTTDANGYAEFVGLPRKAKYVARVNGGPWSKGETADASTTPLVGVLGTAE